MWIILLIFSVAAANDGVSSAIEQAQAAAVKKNRLASSSALQGAMATPGLNKAGRSRLNEALAQLTTEFFTDKGQKEFESGRAQMFDNPDLALAHFNRALALEDHNVVVLTSMAKVQLLKQDCEAAAANLDKALKLNPLAIEPALLRLRVRVCRQRPEGLREAAKTLPVPLERWDDAFVQYLIAQEYVAEKQSRKAFELLNRLVDEQPSFPEGYLWLARAGHELGRDNESWLQKYMSLCKAITNKERRRFSLEPRLCVNMKDVENELATKSTDI